LDSAIISFHGNKQTGGMRMIPMRILAVSYINIKNHLPLLKIQLKSSSVLAGKLLN